MTRCISLVIAATLAWGAEPEVDPASLLSRVRAKVLDSAKTMPRYICRQTLERETFSPRKKSPPGCGFLAEPASSGPSGDATLPMPGFSLMSSDRARLDVIIAEGTELYSWPGGARFETNNPDDLLGGGFAGSGDFASYLLTVFGSGQSTFEYVGRCPEPSCVRYRFELPVAASRYMVRTPIEQVSLAYHGTVDVDPRSADLLAATVIPTDLPLHFREACDLRTRMSYTHTTLNASEFVIPALVEKEYLASDGWYFQNRVQYTGCREYAAESTLTFGDDPPATPAGTTRTAAAAGPRAGAKLELRLATKLDSEANSAGDSIEATLVRPVEGMNGRRIPAGTVVRGHLGQVEKIFSPKRDVTFAMRFDTIIVGGSALRLNLAPTGRIDGRGRGVFEFSGEKVTLDNRFTSRWTVRAAGAAQ